MIQIKRTIPKVSLFVLSLVGVAAAQPKWTLQSDQHLVLTVGGDQDSDHDGVSDSEDDCPGTEDSATVVINGCDTGVDNYLFEDGCSMLDLIEECEAGAGNHGGYVRCVGALASNWRDAGLISGAERGHIMRCVAGSNNHSSPKAMHVGPIGMEDKKQ